MTIFGDLEMTVLDGLPADTLHGQLLCAAAKLDGGEAVAGLIAAFDSDNPPFVCSSAFPAGNLTLPVVVALYL